MFLGCSMPWKDYLLIACEVQKRLASGFVPLGHILLYD